MSANLAVVDLAIPAIPASTERGNKGIAVMRSLVGRRRWLQERPYVKVGDSHRLPDGRRGYEARSNWVHTHH